MKEVVKVAGDVNLQTVEKALRGDRPVPAANTPQA